MAKEFYWTSRKGDSFEIIKSVSTDHLASTCVSYKDFESARRQTVIAIRELMKKLRDDYDRFMKLEEQDAFK